MPLTVKIFLELSLLRKYPKFFLKLIDVDDLVDSRAEAKLKKYQTIEGSDVFKSWFFNLIPQPLKLPLTYVSVTVP